MYMPTNFDCFAKKYWVYMCTPMSFTGSAHASKNIHFYFFKMKNYNILVRLDYMFIAFV